MMSSASGRQFPCRAGFANGLLSEEVYPGGLCPRHSIPPTPRNLQSALGTWLQVDVSLVSAMLIYLDLDLGSSAFKGLT